MLQIENLAAEVEGKAILRGVTLEVPAGEIHAIMGPNGAGKSTLGYVLAGREGYEVTGGSASFEGHDLLSMEPEERAAAGLFLAFQAPIELPGVGQAAFLRACVNAQRRARGISHLHVPRHVALRQHEPQSPRRDTPRHARRVGQARVQRRVAQRRQRPTRRLEGPQVRRLDGIDDDAFAGRADAHDPVAGHGPAPRGEPHGQVAFLAADRNGRGLLLPRRVPVVTPEPALEHLLPAPAHPAHTPILGERLASTGQHQPALGAGSR